MRMSSGSYWDFVVISGVKTRMPIPYYREFAESARRRLEEEEGGVRQANRYNTRMDVCMCSRNASFLRQLQGFWSSKGEGGLLDL